MTTHGLSFIGSDANPSVPRFDDFSGGIDPFYDTDGVAQSNGSLTGVTHFSYDAGYHDFQVIFTVVDPHGDTYTQDAPAITLEMRVGDDPQPVMHSVVNSADPEGVPPLYVACFLDDGHAFSNGAQSNYEGALPNSNGVAGKWTMQVLQDVWSVSCVDPDGGTDISDPDMNLGYRLAPQQADATDATGFTITFAQPVTLVNINFDRPSYTNSSAYLNTQRVARAASATVHVSAQTAPGGPPTLPGPFTTAAHFGITRSPRTLHVASTRGIAQDAAVLSDARSDRVAAANAQAITATVVAGTLSATRVPRAMHASALVLTGVDLLVGSLAQSQVFTADYLVELEQLAGGLSQPQDGDGMLASLEQLAGSFSQPQSLSGLLVGLGYPIIATAAGHRVLLGQLIQSQVGAGLLQMLDSSGQVVSGTSINTPGQRGDVITLADGTKVTYPGVAVRTPREYDTRDGERKPDTETGFSRRKSYERRPVSTLEQLWSFPGAGTALVLSPPYRTMRHKGTLTELAFSCTSVNEEMTSGDNRDLDPTQDLTFGLYRNQALLATMVVPHGRVSWSIPLDLAYDYNEAYAVAILTLGPGVTDAVIHLFFKQTDWLRDAALSTVG